MDEFQVGLVVAEHPHAPMHLNTLRVLDEVTGIHICALAGDDLEALQRAGGAKVLSTTTSLEALLSQRELDALVVAVPNDLCPPILSKAVAAGKPVLFEKPGATSAAALRAVAGEASRAGVTLGAILPWRYHPISQEVSQLVRGGALGKIMTVEARMVTSQVRYRDPSHWLFSKERAGSGILSWLGVHWLDLLGFLIGQRVTSVAALAGQLNPEGVAVEDTACLALRYEQGTLGTLHAGYLLPGSRSGYSGASYDNYLAVRGYDGWITWPGGAPPAYSLYSVAPQWAAAGRQERRFELPLLDAYSGVYGAAFVRDFLVASRAGQPAPCPVEDAVHALEVVEAAVESAATGRTVTIGIRR